MPPGASRATGESTEKEIYGKDVFNAIDQERLMDNFFFAVVILVSRGIAKKEGEAFICSTWNILFCILGGLLKVLSEHRKG